jgi:WD40 repeat protein
MLILDQFEELYTLCQEPNLRDNFIDILLEAIDKGASQRVSPLVLLLTLRADFMGQALTNRPFADALQDGSLILGPMNRDELRAAIQKPAEQQGVAFEKGLLPRILDDVGDKPGNLPLLEFCLTLLWERLDQGWMTHAAYEEIGGVKGALVRYAEEVYTDLNDGEKDETRQVFVQLVQPGQGTEDTRRVASRAEVGEKRWDLIQHLADKRLVVTGQDETGQETVELVHEALIRGWDRISKWMNADRSYRVWQEGLRAAIRVWESSEKDEGALLRGSPLSQAEHRLLERGEDLTRAEREYIQASVNLRVRERARRERRRRMTVAGLTVGLVITLVLFLAAMNQRNIAQKEARLSSAREFAASAINNLDIDPERSILLALQAVNETKTVDGFILREAEEALHQAVSASRLRLTITPEGESSLRFVNFSPDGERLVSWYPLQWGMMRSVPRIKYTSVWDAKTGELLISLPGYRGANYWQDGDRLPTYTITPSHWDTEYSIWDSTSGEELSSTQIDPPGRFIQANCDPNFTRIVILDRSGIISIHDMANGSEIFRIGERDLFPDHVAIFSPDGKRLATGSFTGTVNIWDAQDGEPIRSLLGHRGIIYDLAYSSDGKLIASASEDGTAVVWDANSGEELVTFSGHINEILGVAISVDRNLLATAGMDRKVIVWDLAASLNLGSSQALLTLAGHKDAVLSVSISPDGKNIASTSEDGTIKIWDISPSGGGEGHGFVSGNPIEPWWRASIALNNEGTRLALATSDSTTTIWDTVSGQLLHTLIGHKEKVPTLALSPDSAYLVTRSFTIEPSLGLSASITREIGYHNTIKVWNVSTGGELFSIPDTGYDISELAFSPDGKLLAVGNSYGDVSILDFSRLIEGGWDTADLVKFQLATQLRDLVPVGINFSPDGSKIITSVGGSRAGVWDTTTGEKLLTLSGHESDVFSVVYSPEGEHVATASADSTARIWDAESGEPLHTLIGHQGAVMRVAFSPDGSRLATASKDGTAKIWDTKTGSDLLTLYGHKGGVTDLAFSPDGSLLYTAGLDGTVRVHLLDSEALIALAYQRLTRGFSIEECQQYFKQKPCP